MKLFLGFVFILWMLLTLIFTFSIIGTFMVYKPNFTNYYKYGIEVRTNWMQLGFDIKDALIKGKL